MWMEIEDDVIVGIHSHRCDSPHQWESLVENAKIGDTWKDGRLSSPRLDRQSPDAKRRIAEQEILTRYPVWQQLNILRKGDKKALQEMDQFIERVQGWSNSPESTEKDLSSLVL